MRSPWLSQGYLGDAEKSYELWTDGWLHTGDIGCIGPECYRQFGERVKDVIKTRGEWILWLELEDGIGGPSVRPRSSASRIPNGPGAPWPGWRPFLECGPMRSQHGTDG